MEVEMPVRTQNLADRRADDTRFNDLLQRLIVEWNSPGSPVGTAPDILEEKDHRGRLVNVLVTWDDWADLDAQTRSEMIVDALQAVRGKEAVLELALAMGLTKAEATRFPH
jgi:hypothetical protein